ncbi:hypothetical protein MRB53_019201 [Persea americana]|uniref:Uncharacterized protein n=1 Tax=Persea americana TaxID=3435 RepID=A0ACC2KXE6_PERAE|nr:hypothetical protein MRB53_019201 [Persea americana]
MTVFILGPRPHWVRQLKSKLFKVNAVSIYQKTLTIGQPRNRQAEAGINLGFSNRISDKKEGSVTIPTSGAELLCPSSPEPEKGITAGFALPSCHAASCRKLYLSSSSPLVRSASALSKKTTAGKVETRRSGSLQRNKLGFLGSHSSGEEDRSPPTAAGASYRYSLPPPIPCVGEGEKKKSYSRVSVL